MGGSCCEKEGSQQRQTSIVNVERFQVVLAVAALEVFLLTVPGKSQNVSVAYVRNQLQKERMVSESPPDLEVFYERFQMALGPAGLAVV